MWGDNVTLYSKVAIFGPDCLLPSVTAQSLLDKAVGATCYNCIKAAGEEANFEMMMDDGKWEGQEVLPTTWLDVASTQAMPEGEGAGYGGQTWIPANPVGGECRSKSVIPADTVSMQGHWGQIVAMIPSRDTVIVRMGWTFNGDEAFENCQFLADVLETLPE